MATPINPVPNFSQFNFAVGDTTEVVTKQNGVNATLEQLGRDINTTVESINEDVDLIDQYRQGIDPANIVHAPGSGLPNAAGSAYSREVVGGSGELMVRGFAGLGRLAPIMASIAQHDSLRDCQFYAVNSQSNTAFMGFGAGISIGRSETSSAQIHIPLPGSGESSMQWRTRGQSGWGGIKKIYDTGNILGPVSSLNGAPSGGLFEKGSNDFGRYLKLPDRTLLLWANPPSMTTSSTVLMGIDMPYMPASVSAACSLSVRGGLGSSSRFMQATNLAAGTVTAGRWAVGGEDYTDVQISLFAITEW